MAKFNFDPTIKKYDLNNALRLSEASSLAYESKRKVKEHVKNNWGFKKFEFFDNADTQAFMAANREVIILSFRGTESIQDWITDAKVKFVKGPFGRVHRGFSKALEYVWNNIAYTLHKFQDNKQSVWITGHSLGGALATLAVPKCYERGVKINGLYTFGQPRVGNKTFAGKFDKKYKHLSFRFVNNEDIVTRIPPGAFGYEHIGQVAYFDSFGKLHKDIRWWKKFMDRSVSKIIRSVDRYTFLREQFPNGLDDHSIERYQKLIKRNLKNAK